MRILRMLRRINFHYMEVKNACCMILAGCVMMCFIVFLEPLFFHITQQDLLEYVSNTVSGTAVRMGFLLSYHRSAIQLTEDDSFLALLRSYYEEPEQQTETTEKILENLGIYEEGHKDEDNGVISAINYFMVTTDAGDAFYVEEMSELAEAFLSCEWYLTVVSQDFTKVYSPVLTFCIDGEETEYLCFITRFEMDTRICYSIHLTEFADYLKQLSHLEDLGVSDYMLYWSGDILYQNREDSLIEPNSYDSADWGSVQYGVNTVKTKDGFDFIALFSLKSEKYYLILHMTKREILAPYQPFFGILQLFLGVMVILMIAISLLIIHFLLKRLTILNNQMLEIRNGNYDIDLTDDRSDEIGNIRKTASHMLAAIHREAEEKLAAKETEKQIQYQLMVSAIDPHFIYNTLDTISFLAALGRNRDVIAVNDALIGTLKDRLRMKTYRSFDTVASEKQVLKNYLVIMNYLHTNRMECEYEIAEDTLPLLIPTNILQPLVENAIKHGLLTNKEVDRLNIKKGKVIIGVRREGEKMILFVSDNGLGMSEEQCAYYNRLPAAMSFDAEHVGLTNIKQRLNYLYQKDYQFRITSQMGSGTCVSITVPLSKNMEDGIDKKNSSL